MRLVTQGDIQSFVGGPSQTSFVVNIAGEAVWTAPAINELHGNSAAFGSMGDLHYALSEDDPSKYFNKE